MLTSTRFTGSCLCGAVRYEVTGPLRDAVVCHCKMCRKSHGHIGAYTAAARDAFHLIESRDLKWYRSSGIARRGFCGECGGTLFWDGTGRDTISIAAGTLDAPTGLRTVLQIYVESKGDYYDVDTAIPIRRA
ncbi:MAG: GFA family protein [Betaproteobacteria bacterium]|nr:MAG: GFA family protein [Betaproteobacteria bacterium]